MAVLAPQDWHPPRDHTMDAPSPNAISAAVPRQRSSPANDHSASPTPSAASQQQPYPYPVQQQQAGWSPSPQQFYPSFYQNPHQQPYPMHGHPTQGQMPYYDPTNVQFAQWAYQQMMFNAHQAHQMPHIPPAMGSQRSRSGTASSGDYFGPNQGPAFSPFPSGTPPPHPSQLPNGYQPNTPENQSQYNGFHPYRRPQRHGSHSQDPQQVAANGDWRSVPQHPGAFQPPYVRSDAAGSSTSVNSGSTHSHSPRQRTNSAQGSTSGGSVVGSQSNAKVASTTSHGRGGSTTSASSQASGAPPPRIHHRTGSTSSSASSTVRPAATSSGSTSSVPHGTSTLRKPSPLSQGTFTAAEKRMSRDDSDLTTMLEPAPGVRSGGLKGRLRRALSLNANGVLHEEEEEDLSKHAMPRPSISTLADDESTATVQKKKSRSLFNSRLNRSTDNISLSSTMSSASMVIRKLGSIGKLARRNSLAGITSLFKDKKDKDDEEGGGKKGKKKKGEKGSAADPSVSHATAELDRSDWTASADLAGLSPAARLARQHTLKSNAEAAAKAKAEQEARAAAAAASVAQTQANGEVLPATWEKNTTNRQGENIHGKLGPRVNEAGMRVVVEDDDSDSDDGQSDGHSEGHPVHNFGEGWDDDEEWGEAQDDEDVTIRQSIDGPGVDEDMEPWAINVRRSIERTRVPTKGILKTRVDGRGYEQDTFLQHPNPAFNRTRSNSYDSSPAHGNELPPLVHIPSPNPAQIDGLHKHNLASSNGHTPSSFLPPLSFEANALALDSQKDSASDSGSTHGPIVEKSLFSHPNSSAPALSTMFTANPPTLSHRSATAPAKRLAFASNLSVYDTFPATVYDRRSEPATWSRLTPALAQRIKEELNSYKMEEMEVHAASRVHTQFFV